MNNQTLQHTNENDKENKLSRNILYSYQHDLTMIQFPNSEQVWHTNHQSDSDINRCPSAAETKQKTSIQLLSATTTAMHRY